MVAFGASEMSEMRVQAAPASFSEAAVSAGPFPVSDGVEPAGQSAAAAGPILFYDGTCGFCAASVQFVLRHERGRRTLRFAALQGSTAAALLKRHPELAGIDSMIWYEAASGGRRERLWVRSRAGVSVMAYLGGMWWVLAVLVWCVPRPLRDAAYNAIARNRHRLSGDGAACAVPTPEQRGRFID